MITMTVTGRNATRLLDNQRNPGGHVFIRTLKGTPLFMIHGSPNGMVGPNKVVTGPEVFFGWMQDLRKTFRALPEVLLMCCYPGHYAEARTTYGTLIRPFASAKEAIQFRPMDGNPMSGWGPKDEVQLEVVAFWQQTKDLSHTAHIPAFFWSEVVRKLGGNL